MALTDEYVRFRQWLDAQSPATDVRTVCAVIEQNMGDIAPTTHHSGQRSKRLIPLLRERMDQEVAVADQEAPETESVPWRRLLRLEIGPFRGFRHQEIFDLSSPTVLILGPNGSGKSSLCEALEFALLGSVQEEDERNVKRYLDNAHEGRHVLPRLICEVNGKEHEMFPDEDLHRFILVERNRIEGFARIGARSASAATKMLAMLFGIAPFNDFVSNFGGSLETYLDLALPKAAELALKQAGTAEDQRKIASVAETHEAFDERRRQVAEAFEPGVSYADLKAKIGTKEAPGRLQDIRAILAVKPATPSGVLWRELRTLRLEERAVGQALQRAKQQRQAQGDQVSFLALFQAITELESKQADRCPACETDLSQVAVNPFTRATEGLKTLAELAELERTITHLEQQAAVKRSALDAAIERVAAASKDLPAHLPEAGTEPPFDPYTGEGWTVVIRTARGLQIRDQALKKEQDVRAELDKERERLLAARESLGTIYGEQVQFDADVAKARDRMEVFTKENAKLLLDVAAEAKENGVQVRMNEGYKSYLAFLKQYRDALPEKLMADLNQVVIDIYNQFNAHDHPNDLIHDLRLPLKGGQAMEVAFRGDPERWHNALAMLSEGHLRCLGMAILLAKNIKLGLPTLILDDAVNAIDHDHREGIRNTLFGHPDLAKKQMIITCHSDEFIKDIHNNHAKKADLYTLRPHEGGHHPFVSNGNSRNYIAIAEACFNDNALRGALTASRQALEGLLGRLWKKLGKDAESLAALSLEINRPGGDPNTRHLADVLLAKVNKGLADGNLNGSWEDRATALDTILKAKINSRAWISLNKGIHNEDDREDFEAPTVKRVIGALKAIDETLG